MVKTGLWGPKIWVLKALERLWAGFDGFLAVWGISSKSGYKGLRTAKFPMATLANLRNCDERMLLLSLEFNAAFRANRDAIYSSDIPRIIPLRRM